VSIGENMLNTLEIADTKIGFAKDQAIEDLSDQIKAITRMNAAKGKLKSGATIIAVTSACVEAIKQVSSAASKELCWVIENNPLPTISVDSCTECYSHHLKLIKNTAIEELDKIVTLCGGEKARFEVMNKIESKWREEMQFVQLSLGAKQNELRAQTIRAIPDFFAKVIPLLANFFGGGAVK
jgi:hypothetical protein